MSIEKYLILNKYLISLFGADEFRDLQQKLKDAPVGVDSDGRTHFVNVLRSSFENLKLSEDDLLRYDSNIQSYTKKINFKREGISLKYFQYLAVLFAEIVLDNLKNEKQEFLYELNNFLSNYEGREVNEFIGEFTENDLKKLAYWMATGSGKTLIAHINYYQFFHYKLFSPDHIIFITPNEELSKQHFEELIKSGVPSKLYTGSLSSELKSENEVLVIEMTKFVSEKKGGGVTLSVDVFEGRNLIFVDEGHKGRRSEEQKWAKLRDRLAENGFVFEYSATFGQILSEDNQETLSQYAKSIIYDYSYKYFYLDGYGKDFSVLNVKKARFSEREFQESMFVANLLSFYEQMLLFEENKRLAKEYNLEKPLWIFVGTTVTGKEEESDVIQIVDVINRIIEDENWVKKWINDILRGNTKLKDENNSDLFSNKYEYLRKRGVDFDQLYKKVFGGKGRLHIYELKNAEGEFGLKISENDYFGVINIGDVYGFKNQLEKKGISVEQDAVSGSLFDDIKRENSKINLLIGSKKFIEGWDTWRVSSMGLLNIGTGQGPQIIQLFGRGVRLKGKGMSLKRSEDARVRILETLNVYGIKADYLNRFLEAIRKEEVEFESIEIPVKLQHEDRWKELPMPSKDNNRKFEEERILFLEIDETVISGVEIDLTPKVSIYLAKERKEENREVVGIKTEEIRAQAQPLSIPPDKIDLLVWEKIWHDISQFRIERGYWNLVLNKNVLKQLLLSEGYRIITTPEILEIKKAEDLERLEEIALLVIKKYLDMFYRKHAKEFETKTLRYDNVWKQLPLFVSEETGKKCGYIVQIDIKEKELIAKIRELAKDLNKLIKDDEEILPRIYFDKHIYVPILLQGKKIDRISPMGLVDSESKFVRGLRDFLRINKEKFKGIEVYLLRNYPFSGVGFQLKWSGFYPDFIMWVKKGEKQTIVFIDPKGLQHSKDLNDEKIQFCKNGIKEIEKVLKETAKNIDLESFIISDTSFENLIKGKESYPSKEDYINNHVLFFGKDDQDIGWADKLFSFLLNLR